jgi:hypothetical protein
MDQTTMRSAPCCEASRALHAAVIIPAGAAAVQQRSLVAQAAGAACIARQSCRYGETTPLPPEDDHGTPGLLRLATSRWVQYE